MADDGELPGLGLRGTSDGLLDEPLVVQVRGVGPNESGTARRLVWRARVRDDDGRVWRARAGTAAELADEWAPAKDSAGAVASLLSLRPIALDVRVEAPDGRTASRIFTRRLLGDGVRARRWREPFAATLLLPPTGQAPCAAVVIDATAGGAEGAIATLAGALLASRGVLVLTVAPPRGEGAAGRTGGARDASGEAGYAPGDDIAAGGEQLIAFAHERLCAVPSAAQAPGGVQILPGPFALPPGVPARSPGLYADRRAAAWDELLARLGARPREVVAARSTRASRAEAAAQASAAHADATDLSAPSEPAQPSGASGTSAASSTARPSGESS